MGVVCVPTTSKLPLLVSLVVLGLDASASSLGDCLQILKLMDFNLLHIQFHLLPSLGDLGEVGLFVLLLVHIYN